MPKNAQIRTTLLNSLVALELVVELLVEVHAADVAHEEVLRVAPEELRLQPEHALLLKSAMEIGGTCSLFD